VGAGLCPAATDILGGAHRIVHSRSLRHDSSTSRKEEIERLENQSELDRALIAQLRARSALYEAELANLLPPWPRAAVSAPLRAS
jgi:hypothetical protein